MFGLLQLVMQMVLQDKEELEITKGQTVGTYLFVSLLL